MATITLKHKDGSTSTTALVPETGNPIQIRVPTDAKGGGNIYVRSSVAANGDSTYVFNRMEPGPVK